MKLHEYFSGLLAGSVNINRHRLDQLEAHEKALTDWLRGDTSLGPLLEGVSRQGSWAHRTIIKPQPGREFDADLLVQMTHQASWSADPKRYTEVLHEAMLRSPLHRGKTDLKTRCVRVTYAGDCHVDLVPYVRVPVLGMWNQGYIVNRKANELERVDPVGFAKWVRTRDQDAGGHLRTSLRLLKYMRDYNDSFDVPSVVLTVLVGNRVNDLFALPGRYRDLPTAFRSLVGGTDRWLQARNGVPLVKDPSCTSVNFGHRLNERTFTRFRDQFHGYADAVREAYKSQDRQESIELWRKVFGSAFAPS